MSKTKLKIAILIDQLVPGGVQKDAANEVFYLSKFGHDAQLLVLMRRGWRPKYKSFFPNIPTQFLSDKYPKLLKNSFKFPIFTFFSTLHLLSPYLAPSKIKPRSIDIIVAHGTTTCLTALSLWKKHRIPYIAIINDPMEYILKKVYSQTALRYLFFLISPLLFYLERQIVKNAKGVVVLSQKHLPYIQKKYSLTPEILLPGSLPLKTLPEERLNYLIASSRWESGKNPYLLLQIAKALPKTPMIIAGNWTNKSDLSQFKRELQAQNLSSQVILKTDVLPEKLNNLYKNALAWVHPNVEAFGLGGFEAASCGCPVVMPRGSGLSQILKDKIDGFFVKNTAAEFIKALKFLVNNPKIANQMGRSAWLTIKSGHSWENHTKQLENLITDSIRRLEVVALETGHAQGTVISGGDKLLEEMSPYLKRDISLTVIVPKIAAWHWKNQKRAKVITLGKKIFDNSASPFAVFINYLFRILETTKILYFIKNKDIVYSSTNVFPDVVPAYFAKLVNPKIKWFARIHHLSESPIKRPGNILINLGSNILQEISVSLLHNKADLVAALNSNLYETLKLRNFQMEKLLIVTAGINSKNWSPAKVDSPGSQTKNFDAIFLGRLHPSKGIFDLVPIWQQVTKNIPSAKLAIIGHATPAIKSKIKKQIQREKLAANIKILGALPNDQVKKYLNDSKIFLFTDHEAGFGLAATEAMAMGLPVVGWDIGILGKVFKEGFLKIDPFDTANFAKALVNLLQNDNKRQILSWEAHLEAQKHDWQKVATNFQKILYSLKSQM